MTQPKTKHPIKAKRKTNVKVKVKQNARLKKKGESADSLRKAPTKTVLPTNGITFKVKIRKK